jgi:acylphosphatase
LRREPGWSSLAQTLFGSFENLPISNGILRGRASLHQWRAIASFGLPLPIDATKDKTTMPENRTIAAIIQGRVQGVGYRVWTRSEADRQGLSGHVRNRPDGSVEALFSGAPDAVARMLEACRQGPPGARVTDIAVTEDAAAPPEAGFAIR